MAEKYKVRLENRNPPHYKQYTVWIVAEGGAYKVYFNYGKIGTAGVTGVKTPKPVMWEIAHNTFNRLISEKVSNGYSKVPGESKKPLLMVQPEWLGSQLETNVTPPPKPKKAKKEKKKPKDEDEPKRSIIV